MTTTWIPFAAVVTFCSGYWLGIAVGRWPWRSRRGGRACDCERRQNNLLDRLLRAQDQVSAAQARRHIPKGEGTQ